MSSLIGPKSLWVAALLGAIALTNAPPALASTLTYNLTNSYQSGNTCTGCGPFGSVTVSTVTGFTNEVTVGLNLKSGEVFSFGGAGFPLVFDISGNPTASATGLPSGFSLSQTPMAMADGTGTWNYEITCSSCPTGTGGGITGPLNFTLTVASGTITPASFIQNANGLFFASDIGVPNGSGSYFTGDVAAPSVTAVPLPASLLLFGSALAGLFLMLPPRNGLIVTKHLAA